MKHIIHSTDVERYVYLATDMVRNKIDLQMLHIKSIDKQFYTM